LTVSTHAGVVLEVASKWTNWTNWTKRSCILGQHIFSLSDTNKKAQARAWAVMKPEGIIES
jgi:hypothetical protein